MGNIKLDYSTGWHLILVSLIVVLLSSCSHEPNKNDGNLNTNLKFLGSQYYSTDTLVAKTYNSGFKHDNELSWRGISAASDGNIYYVLCSHKINYGAKMFMYNPKIDQTKFLGDLTKISGEGNMKAVPQGKSHNRLQEMDGKLYFATHIGYFQSKGGAERMSPTVPKGYQFYPGGQMLSYDLSTGKFQDLAKAPKRQGIIDFVIDKHRKQLYGITWPGSEFLHYNMKTDKLENLGKTMGDGEAGIFGKTYRVVSRGLILDPTTGFVYFSTSEGDIDVYKPSADSISKVKGVSLKLDYLGQWDPTQPGVYGYNWRELAWDPNKNVIYGVTGESGYLFQFNPRKPSLKIIRRLTAVTARRRGMFAGSHYGYLGFRFGPKGHILYYLTPGPVKSNKTGKDSSKKQLMHLITYNTTNGKYIDHGPIYDEKGKPIIDAQDIAVTSDAIYTIGRFKRGSKKVVDLVKIPNPMANKY